MMQLATTLITDASLCDGHMIGLDKNGTVIVELQITPIFKRIIGEENDDRDVATWRVSPGHVKRMAAICAWQQTGHYCGGNA